MAAGLFCVALMVLGSVGWAASSTDSEETSSKETKEAVKAEDLPTFDEIMEKVDDLYRSKSSHSTLTMTVEKPRNTRELKMEMWTKGEDYALVVIREPAREEGTATLRTPDGLWNYAPRADRLIRIPSGLLSENWMGSHFTNDDLMRETNYDTDYEGTVERDEHDGDTMLKVTLTPRPDTPVVYSKMVFWVKPGTWVPVRQEFYDDGEVVRTMRFTDMQEVNGRTIPMKLVVKPTDEDDERTEMVYEELEFDVDVDDQMFSRRGLRRVAK
jgi:outer membrane lipoprotein-sorting protein